MTRPRFTPEAARDYVEATRWHESEHGRGNAFRVSIKAALEPIAHNPDSFPVVAQEFRRIVVRRFPYAVFFRVEAGQVVVHAVFPTSQNPSTVRGRLRDA